MVMLAPSFVLVDFLVTIENPTHIFRAAAGPWGTTFVSPYLFLYDLGMTLLIPSRCIDSLQCVQLQVFSGIQGAETVH
jgi:hypothetical protein